MQATRRAIVAAALALMLPNLSARAADADAVPFEVPEGFSVSVYATDDLATDIHTMTLDAQGRVVVASTGYVKRLEDTNGDGQADRATSISDHPARGAQGMAFDGDRLIITGDNAVNVLRDSDDDGRLDDREQWATLRHPEHGTNGVLVGPDGWVYVITGNDAGASTDHVTTDHSPVRRPHRGSLVRFKRDGSASEVVAHGLRNPYDLAFNPLGHVFTYDADGERDYHLPWYTPTRMFDLAQGGHHGWVLEGWRRAWNRPEAFFDNTDRLHEVGRGSPTGVTAYRHHRFPERYRGGVFAACWTYGTVYHFPLEPAGDTYRTTMETFIRPTGSAGFAPVALEVGPEGELYVAIGGRGTRGGIYRIDYVGDETPAPAGRDELERILLAPQPLTAWSRAEWIPAAEQLGREAFQEAAADEGRPAPQRIRAIEILVERFDGIDARTARQILREPDPFVTARTAWALSRHAVTDDAAELLAELTHHEHPHVQRAAWEALGTLNDLPAAAQPAWAKAAESSHRRIRSAAVHAARHAGNAAFSEAATSWQSPQKLVFRNRVTGPAPHGHDIDAARDEAYLDRVHRIWREAEEPQPRLAAVRMWQLALGDILANTDSGDIALGYSAQAPEALPESRRRQIIDALGQAFPTEEPVLDREIARLLAMLRVTDRPDLIEAVARRLDHADRPRHVAHYLLALAHLEGERSAEVTQQVAHSLATLHSRYREHDLNPADNWPRHMRAAVELLLTRDESLAPALVQAQAFGSADQVLFLDPLKAHGQRVAAARRILNRAEASGDWSARAIRALAVLPADEVLPPLRKLWEADEQHRDAIAVVLAEHAQPADSGRLVESLSSMDANVVARSAAALEQLASEPGEAELVAAMRAFSRHRQQQQAAEATAALLQHWTGETFSADYQAWAAWFSEAHPDAADDITLAHGANVEQWMERLKQVDWEAGDADRGEAIFEQRLCASCHQASQRLGPDLRGITERFSREDLFLHTVDPNAAISPLYQAVQITTNDGEVHVGVTVYKSPQATLLQTGIDTTVRITGDRIDRVEPARISPMPPNLLEGLTDQQLADFYRYLEALE